MYMFCKINVFIIYIKELKSVLVHVCEVALKKCQMLPMLAKMLYLIKFLHQFVRT